MKIAAVIKKAIITVAIIQTIGCTTQQSREIGNTDYSLRRISGMIDTIERIAKK